MKSWRFQIGIMDRYGHIVHLHLDYDVTDIEYCKLYKARAGANLLDVDEALYERVCNVVKNQEKENIIAGLKDYEGGDPFQRVEIFILV